MTSSIDSSVVWNSDALIDAAMDKVNIALKAGVHITLAKAIDEVTAKLLEESANQAVDYATDVSRNASKCSAKTSREWCTIS